MSGPSRRDVSASAESNEEAMANIEQHLNSLEDFWAGQSAEVREVNAELNGAYDDNVQENAWGFLDEGQQQALRQKLQGGDKP